MMDMRCGLVALVGAPNVGKSTLLNKLVGEKIGIVSPKANTTRVCVRGVVTEGEAQLVFVDTPGLNESSKAFDRLLVQQAQSALAEADVVMLVVDAVRGFDKRAMDVVQMLKQSGQVAVLVMNKVDLVQPRSKLLALMQKTTELDAFRQVYAVDAQHGKGTEDIIAGLKKLLPEGPWLFPAEMRTDLPLPVRMAEITREKTMLYLQQELPYGVMVVPQRLEDEVDSSSDDKGRLMVQQNLLVAVERHKGMIVGQGGSMLQRIGTAARLEMQEITGRQVYLDLQVVVQHDWQQRESLLRELGLVN